MNSRKQLITTLTQLDHQYQMYQNLAYKHAVYLLQWTQAHTLALVLGSLSFAIIGGRYKTAGLFFVGIKHMIQRIAVKKMAGILYHARNM